MKSSKEFMNEFMNTLNNMKKYQGIDITNPNTYCCDAGIVHEAFSLEKNIKTTVDSENDNEELNKPKQLILKRKRGN